jgi:hypothetical protein
LYLNCANTLSFEKSTVGRDWFTVKLFDLEISRARLALRVFTGFILASMTLFLFYYLPLHMGAIAGHFVPTAFVPIVDFAASTFASSTLPLLGALLAILVFTETILKGTWAFGALLIIVGSFWILYDLTLYRAGLLFSNLIPSGITLANGEQLIVSTTSQSDLVLLLTGVIIIFVISSVITIIRGARILYFARVKARPAFSAGQTSI